MVYGMLAGVDHTLCRLKEVRIDVEFHSIYSQVLLDQAISLVLTSNCNPGPFSQSRDLWIEYCHPGIEMSIKCIPLRNLQASSSKDRPIIHVS
jgi:hypothetical protein